MNVHKHKQVNGQFINYIYSRPPPSYDDVIYERSFSANFGINFEEQGSFGSFWTLFRVTFGAPEAYKICFQNNFQQDHVLYLQFYINTYNPSLLNCVHCHLSSLADLPPPSVSSICIPSLLPNWMTQFWTHSISVSSRMVKLSFQQLILCIT